ncbi:ABC transporter related protein [Desulfosarcina cetonica]|uniref:ABC transporter ATP-binding protein n=1 Tax=Desulfosarcina cetonica TaxID=90730 RepID=UPI0006D11BF9|nr:ABC transporter ATP-binding protein [Desulfosarcina cetonica]VTR63760.1 ABC transporter related protein [Desulfosarcina cetonica]
MIRITNLKKNYGEVAALAGINLTVNEGELFAYLGPNGAGKTTTIRILTGLTRLSGGSARLGGHDIETETLAAKRQYGLVPQHINLDSELTVHENLLIHGRLYHMRRQAIGPRIDELLGYIELEEKRHTLVKKLSGGMKRRVMIARALLHAPSILFLDEPTVGLDAAIRRRLWGLIKKIQQDGVTIFLTTHYIEEAEFLAKRVAFIDKGRIVGLDTPQHFMAAVGRWAMDRFEGDGMQTAYFETQEAAKAYAAEHHSGFSIRRVNLEDAFLKMTGKKVQ